LACETVVPYMLATCPHAAKCRTTKVDAPWCVVDFVAILV